MTKYISLTLYKSGFIIILTISRSAPLSTRSALVRTPVHFEIEIFLVAICNALDNLRS